MSKVLLFIILLLLLDGCEKKHVYSSVDANLSIRDNRFKELEDRHLDYWEAMSLADYDESYRFELPYLNFLKTNEWYREFRSGSREKYKIVIKGIESDSEDDNIAFVKTHIILKHTDYTFKDRWLYVNGTWYHSYSPSLLPKKFD